MFDETPTSWVAHAKQNDLELLRAASHAGQLDRGPAPKPSTVEYGLTEDLLAQLLATVQSALAPEGTRVRVLAPATARDQLDEETAIAEVAVINAAMTEVTDEQYEAFAAGLWDGLPEHWPLV